MKNRMPALFVGHGNPMHAITRTPYSTAWSELGRSLPRPRAILAISAHWYVDACAVTVMPAPRTIHDFGGFPRELHEVNYPAPGSPELAWQVRNLLAPARVELDEQWGLDHGTWSVLVHMFPEADIPVVQLSIDARQPSRWHHDVGQRLTSLRDDGIMVMASGNIVHNLYEYAWGNPEAPPADWAIRFEELVRQNILADTPDPLIDYQAAGRDAKLAVPTPDHYLPLLYILGLRRRDDPTAFPVTGIEGGALSMLAVQFG